MYYEINVSKVVKNYGGERYHHFFATAKRSLTTREDFEKLLLVFNDKFPKPEYRLSAAYYPENGEYIDVDKILNNSIWDEISNNYVEDGVYHIDAWSDNDHNGEGKLIATINTNYEPMLVEYLDERAKTDNLAQVKINEILNN